MANIMIRRGDKGEYVFYLPKRDLEDTIVSMEFDTPEKWGGEIKLNNGGSYFIEPQTAPEPSQWWPELPWHTASEDPIRATGLTGWRGY